MGRLDRVRIPRVQTDEGPKLTVRHGIEGGAEVLLLKEGKRPNERPVQDSLREGGADFREGGAGESIRDLGGGLGFPP